MFEDTKTFTNTSDSDQAAWIEPWCEEIPIPTGKTLVFTGRGSSEGEIEIEACEGGIVVYGWSSSTINVECDGEKIWQAYFEVPPLPPGMTVKGFAKMLFHRQ
jgi:hypothetical protein